MFRQLGAAELILLLMFAAFVGGLGFGLYWLIRKAVADGRRDRP